MSVANHEAQSWRLSAGTRRSQRLLVLVPLLALGGGAALAWSGHLRVAQFLWAAGTAPVLLALMISAALSLSRGAIGLDIIAALAMGSALVGGIRAGEAVPVDGVVTGTGSALLDESALTGE